MEEVAVGLGLAQMISLSDLGFVGGWPMGPLLVRSLLVTSDIRDALVYDRYLYLYLYIYVYFYIGK